MIITTDKNKYKVTWGQAGFSYATPKLYIQKQLWIFPMTYWKFIWEGTGKTYINARKAHKNEITKWFMETVNQYESYEKSWEKK